VTTNINTHLGLRHWHRTLKRNIAGQGAGLTGRQMAILLTVYLSTPPHTVRGLAKDLGVAKPVISRALDTLGKLGFLKRKRDEADKRNIFIQRTVRGAVYLSEFADTIQAAGEGLDFLE
jgi:DNA-binding MarR family transcriptional regulator